jgi:ATP-dependent Clp protease adaptor protein ClpS
MPDTTTLIKTETNVSTQPPWNVVVHDDPVNLMAYVTYVLMKIFGYNEQFATRLMLQVHQQGLSIVWSGELEKAEFYVQQLQFHQLKTSLEQAE